MSTQNFPPQSSITVTPGVDYEVVNATSEQASFAINPAGPTPISLLVLVPPNSERGFTGPEAGGSIVNNSQADLTLDSPEVQNLPKGRSVELVPKMRYVILNNTGQDGGIALAFNLQPLVVFLGVKAHSRLDLEGPVGGATVTNSGNVDLLVEGLNLQNLPPNGTIAMEQDQTYVVFNTHFQKASIGIAYNILNLAFYAEVPALGELTVKSPQGGGYIQNRSGFDLQVETPEL